MSNHGGTGRDASQLKDLSEAVDENHLYSWVARVWDDELSRVLADRKASWEEHKEKFGFSKPYEHTKEFDRVISKRTTLTATNSVKTERYTMLKYLTSRAEKPELKNLRQVKWLIEFLQNPPDKDNVVALHISAKPNAGKSNFGFFIGEMWLLTHPNGRVLTNSKSAGERNQRFVYIKTMDELDEWIENNPDTPFFFVFDEANKALDDEFNREAVQKQFYPLATLIRHKGGNYAVIGHSRNDIPKKIRALTTFIKKPSQKVADFYNTVEDENGEQELEKMKTLRNVPPTSVDYEGSGDTTEWEWSEQRINQCFGETTDGDRCNAVVRTEYGEDPEYFCPAHHNQAEPHEEVGEDELLDTPYEPEGLQEDDDIETSGVETDCIPENSSELLRWLDGDIEARESPENDSNPTRREFISGFRDSGEEVMDTVDEKLVERAESDEPTLEDVPEEYWDIVFDRTGGVTKHDVEDLEHLEQLLSERQFERLMSKIE